MKRLKELFLLITCVVCLLFMFGCESKKGKENEDNSTTEIDRNITGSSNEVEQSTAHRNNGVNYSIKTKSILTTNINVNYPQIVGLDDIEIQKKWNEIIKNKVESDMNYIGSSDKYFLSYEIKTQNEEMISILMIGESSSSSSDKEVRPFKYTYNIDLQTGNGIRLKDRVDTEKLAMNLLSQKKYSLVDTDSEAFSEYMKVFYNKKELMDALNEYDFGESLTFTKGYSYFENGKIYICMSVNRKLGNYVEILIDN